MSDRDLLEKAAKAAGYEVRWVDAPTSFNYEGFRRKTGKKNPAGFDVDVQWNPLTDDGDALRLAVKLRLQIDCERDGVRTTVGFGRVGIHTQRQNEVCNDDAADPYAATRRAITRAAAAMGEKT